MPDIEVVWSRIKSLEGHKFSTKTGAEFIFWVVGSYIETNRTKYKISKKDFEKALALVPFDGPGVVNHKVRGPAYVWAILHDPRVRKDEW